MVTQPRLYISSLPLKHLGVKLPFERALYVHSTTAATTVTPLSRASHIYRYSNKPRQHRISSVPSGTTWIAEGGKIPEEANESDRDSTLYMNFFVCHFDNLDCLLTHMADTFCVHDCLVLQSLPAANTLSSPRFCLHSSWQLYHINPAADNNGLEYYDVIRF